MLALLLVLFFGATGISVNHPDWTFGFDATTESSSGTLPQGWLSADGTVEFLTVSEHLRSVHGVRGAVADFGAEGAEGYVGYRGPGYTADVFIDLLTGDYDLTVEQQGLVGVLNDLHKGRDAGSAWSWVIDLSGAFLVAIAVTGLGLQLFLPKRRKAALTVVGVGLAAAVTLGLFAAR